MWKTAGRRANGLKFGTGGGVYIQCIQGTFDSEVLKVSTRLFGAFPIFLTVLYPDNG